MSISVKIKKSSRYVLLTWPLQDITWINHISLLRKHLIMYWWKTWADWYGDNITFTTTTKNSTNIVYMVVPVERYWKTIWKDESYMSHKDLSSQKLTIKKDMFKFTETEYQLPFIFCNLQWFRKRFTWTRLVWAIIIEILHRPIPASWTMWDLHLREMQWRTILWKNPYESRGQHRWKVFEPGPSYSNHL